LWFRSRDNFLKTRIVPQRIPFPALSQIRKGDAFVGIIHREWNSKETFNPAYSLVLLADVDADQSVEIFYDSPLDDIMRDGLEFHRALRSEEHTSELQSPYDL